MKTRVHELHPMLVHMPLAMLPSAVIVDLAAVITGERSFDKTARTLWWATAASGLSAGLAGLASSQEVKAEDSHTQGMMFLHGLGNAVVVLGALGVAAWRSGHRPSLGSSLLGLGALAAAGYTAWLGGEMVYSQGVGMNEQTMSPAELERRSPPLRSLQAPGRILRDAVKGLGWLLSRARGVLSGQERIDPSSFGVKAVEPSPQQRPLKDEPRSRPEFRTV